MSDYNTAFEIIAKMFEIDTGLLAPGKDDADTSVSYEERKKEFKKWQEKNSNHIKAVDNILIY